ncbi:hypothetical protein L1049_005303 [Liquidambar formosana]|uniref:C2H2-type domain-containing protein n=1 Tax=Liquidambar formosana TaxID=63359 RepID=A0AAP0WZ47_LIQFO
MENTRMSSDKFMDTWDYNSFGFEGKDPSGFLWPPRHYTCSFCRRKFKSAQALGGHMNVHRRDRAMLRQPPPWAVECPNPNPSPNPNYSSSSLTSFSSLSSASTDEEKMPMVTGCWCNPLSPRHGDITKRSMRGPLRFGKLKGFAREDEFKVLNNGETVRLDLELGLLGDAKEGVDLELRLGYS